MKKILTNSEEINDLLEGFKKEGYDRIHIAGGTSKDGGHYSGVIGFKFDSELKKIGLVGLPYDSNFYKRESNLGKDAGHTKKDNETPEETAVREFFEETGLKTKAENLIQVHYDERPNNRPDRKNEMHLKYYYLVDIDKCTGELASFDGPNPIDGETLAPILVVTSEFERIVFGGHKIAVKKALDKLRTISMEIYNAL